MEEMNEKEKQQWNESINSLGVKLEELIPQPTKFSLEQTGKTYQLRPVTLDDQSWMQTLFGGNNQVKTAMKGMDANMICRFIYHQMDQESRKEFPSMVVEEMDDEGELGKRKLKGWEVFKKQVLFPQELIMLYTKALKVMGISEPLLDKMEMEAVKKKETEMPQ